MVMGNGQGKTFEVMLSVNCGVGSLSLPASLYDCGLKLSKYLCKLTSTQCSYFLLILTLQISPHYATSCSDSLVVH